MYSKGNQRLFYQSSKDVLANVTATIRLPDLTVKGPFEMTPVDYKLYYLDVVFMAFGTHVFDVYEDSVRTHREFITVSDGNIIFYPEGNVI